MSDLDRSKRAALAHAAAHDEERSDLWIACAAMVFVAVVVGGGLVALSVEYRGGWVANHQVAMDKSTAIPNLLFRE
jgi:hypothetical protein